MNEGRKEVRSDCVHAVCICQFYKKKLFSGSTYTNCVQLIVLLVVLEKRSFHIASLRRVRSPFKCRPVISRSLFSSISVNNS